MRYLAIDYGLKRTGLAVCDPDEIISSPLEVIDQPNRVIPAIVEIVKSYGIDQLVVGLPLNMDGTEGHQAKQTRQFVNNLKKHLQDIPINLFDERLSSFNAGQKLKPAELTNKKRKKRMDAVAAAEILKGFLESKKQ